MIAVTIGLVLLRTVPARATDEDRGAPARPDLVRIGIAPGTWWGVNHNDAQAAITAWAKIIVQHVGAHGKGPGSAHGK